MDALLGWVGFGTPKPEPAAEQGQQDGSTPPPQPTQNVLARMAIGLAFYGTWMPYTILLILQDIQMQNALIFGTAFSGDSGFCVVFHLLLFWPLRRKKELPYMLDGFMCIYFLVFTAIWFQKPHFHREMNRYMNVSLHAWIAAGIGVTVMIRFPFTVQYAREVVPKVAWKASSFLATCNQIAVMWTLAFSTTCLLSLVPLLTGRDVGMDAINAVFNYGWPFASLVLLLLMTRWWPRFVRVQVYIPRAEYFEYKGGPVTANDLPIISTLEGGMQLPGQAEVQQGITDPRHQNQAGGRTTDSQQMERRPSTQTPIPTPSPSITPPTSYSRGYNRQT